MPKSRSIIRLGGNSGLNPMPRQANKILVIRLSSIGDIVLTTPLLRSLQHAFPDVEIDYCTKPAFVSLLASNPRLSAIYTTKTLPSGGYDCVVDLQNNVRSHSIVRSLRSPQTFRYRKENWKKWLLVNFKFNLYGEYRSVVDRYHDALNNIERASDQPGCELYLTIEEQAYATATLTSGKKTLALCFGAKHFTKRYPPKQFAAIVTLLLTKEPLQIVLLGGREDAAQAKELMDNLPNNCLSKVINLAGCSTLMQTAAILANCDAVLCNDTGLMHIASAFGKMLFVLFGSSSSAFGFLPWHTPYELFELDALPCRPCSHIGRDYCPKDHFRCMTDLSPALIVNRISNYFQSTLRG